MKRSNSRGSDRGHEAGGRAATRLSRNTRAAIGRTGLTRIDSGTLRRRSVDTLYQMCGRTRFGCLSPCEGLQGGEASVSRPRGVAADSLNVFQERKDQRRIQLLQDEG